MPNTLYRLTTLQTIVFVLPLGFSQFKTVLITISYGTIRITLIILLLESCAHLSKLFFYQEIHGPQVLPIHMKVLFCLAFFFLAFFLFCSALESEGQEDYFRKI